MFLKQEVKLGGLKKVLILFYVTLKGTKKKKTASLFETVSAAGVQRRCAFPVVEKKKKKEAGGDKTKGGSRGNS